jgi:hypothetical protein
MPDMPFACSNPVNPVNPVKGFDEYIEDGNLLGGTLHVFYHALILSILSKVFDFVGFPG